MRSIGRRVALATLVCTFVIAAACGGKKSGGGTPPELTGEDDWSLPAYAVASTNSGFFSEALDGANHVDVRVVDVTWRQLKPTAATLDTNATGHLGEDYALDFPSLSAQLADPAPYWLRVWITTEDAVPQWVLDACPSAKFYGPGYESDHNIGLWDPCVWGHALDLYTELLQTQGLKDDPRLVMVYVPGAFTYAEFDYDMMVDAESKGELDFATFHDWFEGATQSLVNMMGPSAGKLVFTGEDFPFGPESWGTGDDLLAKDAVEKGMSIRNGITELFDFHLNEVPAYGTTIAADGHLATNETAAAFAPGKIRATENECYTDCGFSTSDVYYAVKMSNLKTLQLRMNWEYVVPGPSRLVEYDALWKYMRLELGKNVYDSPDAWVALRDAEDRYWEGADPAIDCQSLPFSWSSCPYVRNWERWIVQKDVAADGMPKRGSERRENVLGPENGIAFEGLSTDPASGMDSLYFDVDERFLAGVAGPLELKVTWLDDGNDAWSVQYATSAGTASTAPVPSTHAGWTTTTFPLDGASFAGAFANGSDFRIHDGGVQPLEVRFVRLVKLVAP